MAELKTKATKESVEAYISGITPEVRRKEAEEIVQLLETLSGYPPVLWGTSIIGFGAYHYESTRSAQKGDWPLIGFSPRKTALSLYIMDGLDAHAARLEKLGPHTRGVGCLYIKKLADIDKKVLTQICKDSLKVMKKKAL